ncbi:hypothetical protein HYG86_17525 [Alkalicella caledoniensis]|uniref:Uncharacterized protein n=1 Tax=Alkalicella caledoniensis TaxID=2731377 RepID=A0A7G9WCN4_ALKCA|nr:hypothetical protein [Alkalicella caledoniensis]QNO16446.1 hypothetical protein HYG86_17525 [Alkalicella caledoniensis]
MGKLLIGLGSGIIVTLLIFTLVQSEMPNYDETRIITEAKELGMVFPQEIEEEIRSEIMREISSFEPKTVEIEIPPNISASKISEILTSHGFDGEKFLLKISQLDVANHIKYGTFQLNENLSTEEIILILTN